ncbi:hypothetical protein STEG23_010563 [Scotinomys teguina]
MDDIVERSQRWRTLRASYPATQQATHKTYGNMLVLDGVIQCTERDEFSYQKMIANLLLCSTPNPWKCEIDEDVIEVSKKFLPGMAIGYSSSKLTLHVGNGSDFMKQNQDAFDIIITDSSDPMGPAESLFKESYYRLMEKEERYCFLDFFLSVFVICISEGC